MIQTTVAATDVSWIGGRPRWQIAAPSAALIGAITTAWLMVAPLAVVAAPDEERLGKASGFPVGRAGGSWIYDESFRVGSFTHQAEIAGLYNGRANRLDPAARPMPLPSADIEPDYRWGIDELRNLRVDDFLARQRITGLLIVKDGVIQVERYQYDRTASDRFTSHSMAKSITSLGIGIALREGRIKSLDDRAETYVPGLGGTLYGATTIRQLLRMSSGARFAEIYSPGAGDNARFNSAAARDGVIAAARVITEREVEAGAKFNYASAETTMLGAVLAAATGQSLSNYLTPRLWQAIGAEHSAFWRADRTGLEVASANFNATLRDYARLGVVLANDGVRPDDPSAEPLVPRDYLLDATDTGRVPPAFRPGAATASFGYGYQFWLLPGERRRFVMLGVYGQSVFIDPGLKLVIVQTAVNTTAEAGRTSLARERTAFWRGVVRRYGSW